MRISRASDAAMKFACLKFHYAKSIPANPLAYNIYNAMNEWCGCILFARGSNPNIGTSYGLGNGECLELVRVALNGKQECTSMAVAMALKQLKTDCPLCRLVVSYADCDQNHLGTIYQATNWIYTGCMGENTKDGFIVKGKKMHRRSVNSHKGGQGTLEWVRKNLDPNADYHTTKGKRKYLFPLDKGIRRRILPLAQPYPKTDEKWVKIDRNKFKKENDEVQ